MASPANSEPAQSIFSRLDGWGSSSLPPMGLATLITALHWRPFHALPMLFTPLLVFSSYLTLAGFKTDGAAMTAAWSGMYVLLAARRKPAMLRNKFTLRGAVRGTAMGLGSANFVAGAYTYANGNREAEGEERRERNRWNVYKNE
ncbi:hypothetical protein B0T22DRAFT_247387 [Podospora appendiculata]|uniref:Altered inheritance of mitochondria protein 19 n=1 Tax=Podospora appendiculata TaxID=314037 RepID=A0AAE1C8S2_9PEZI|nr:hypothetical protein B0T22DRAFT_247387 [Podospora appendiculata]